MVREREHSMGGYSRAPLLIGATRYMDFNSEFSCELVEAKGRDQTDRGVGIRVAMSRGLAWISDSLIYQHAQDQECYVTMEITGFCGSI